MSVYTASTASQANGTNTPPERGGSPSMGAPWSAYGYTTQFPSLYPPNARPLGATDSPRASPRGSPSGSPFLSRAHLSLMNTHPSPASSTGSSPVLTTKSARQREIIPLYLDSASTSTRNLVAQEEGKRNRLGMFAAMAIIIIIFLALVGVVAWALTRSDSSSSTSEGNVARYCIVVSINDAGAPSGSLNSDLTSDEAKQVEKLYCDALKEFFGDAFLSCDIPYKEYRQCFVLYDSKVKFIKDKLTQKLGYLGYPVNDSTSLYSQLNRGLRDAMEISGYNVFKRSHLIQFLECPELDILNYHFDITNTITEGFAIPHQHALATPGALLCGEIKRALAGTNLASAYHYCATESIKTTYNNPELSVDAHYSISMDQPRLEYVTRSKSEEQSMKQYITQVINERVEQNPGAYPVLEMIRAATRGQHLDTDSTSAWIEPQTYLSDESNAILRQAQRSECTKNYKPGHPDGRVRTRL